MTPDELRALAKALDKITPVMGLEELHHMETLDRAADFLRQCAEQREPLSDDDINKLAWKQNLWTDHMIEFSFLAFAREVERAHGIGGSDDAK